MKKLINGALVLASPAVSDDNHPRNRFRKKSVSLAKATKGMHLRRDERRALDAVDPRVIAYKQAFLATYAETASMKHAAAMIGIKYGMVQDWLDDARSEKPIDKDFAKELVRAKDEACCSVEDEITRRGKEGVDEPIVAQGELVFQPFKKGTNDPLYSYRTKEGEIIVVDPESGERLELGTDYVIRPLTVKRYSDKLLLARARALMPDKYGFHFTNDKNQQPEKSATPHEDGCVIDVREEEAHILEEARKNGRVH